MTLQAFQVRNYGRNDPKNRRNIILWGGWNAARVYDSPMSREASSEWARFLAVMVTLLRGALFLTSGLVALVMGAVFFFDLRIILGMDFPNYRDPQHRELGDALMSSPLAPLLHLALLVGSLMLCARLWRRPERTRR